MILENIGIAVSRIRYYRTRPRRYNRNPEARDAVHGCRHSSQLRENKYTTISPYCHETFPGQILPFWLKDCNKARNRDVPGLGVTHFTGLARENAVCLSRVSRVLTSCEPSIFLVFENKVTLQIDVHSFIPILFICIKSVQSPVHSLVIVRQARPLATLYL